MSSIRFTAAHPGVRFEIAPLESESFKTKLTTNVQAGDPPDVFRTGGGGVLFQQFQSQYSAGTARILAYVTLAMLPSLVCYALAECQLIGGLTSGLGKG